MYINSDIPSNYKYVAELSDNYIVLVRESVLSSNNSYDAYIQFFQPSTNYIHVNDYVITNGNNYTYDFNYTFNQYYNYIDNVELTFTKDLYQLNDISNDIGSAYDYPFIFICQFLCVIAFVWIVNQLTKIVCKGGVFG